MSGFTHDVAGGSGNLIAVAVQSPAFVSGSAGWQIRRDGSAEFDNLTVRGTFAGSNFLVNTAGIFFYGS